MRFGFAAALTILVGALGCSLEVPPFKGGPGVRVDSEKREVSLDDSLVPVLTCAAGQFARRGQDNWECGEPDLGQLLEHVARLDGELTRLGARAEAAEERGLELADEVARLEEGDCPPGYARDSNAGSSVLCVKGADEIVKVATGAIGFWIDRYETSLWADEAASTGAAAGFPYGASADNLPVSFPRNGQWSGTNVPVYAISKAGVTPTRYLTWFQAQAACRARGKRLPRRDEWLEAARRTDDPGANDGKTNALCHTRGIEPRQTGAGTNCASSWGAQDLIGNLGEWVDEWYAGPSDGTESRVAWPGSLYADDSISNIASWASPTGTVREKGFPVAAARGGAWDGGIGAGIFALDLASAPSRSSATVGFRCILPHAR